MVSKLLKGRGLWLQLLHILILLDVELCCHVGETHEYKLSSFKGERSVPSNSKQSACL